ncbi:MAG: acetyl-coenzyme A synthetase, partial [Bacteroidetes bacterium]|nr:acetyl-coenzyme A synthetase [Bacteroidota bacterium]
MSKQIKSLEEYKSVYNNSIEQPEIFWGEVAQSFEWIRSWDKVQSGSFSEGNVKWFDGAELNITTNCIDRHLAKDGEKVAFIWEPNDTKNESISITYQELHDETCKLANSLKSLGITKG